MNSRKGSAEQVIIQPFGSLHAVRIGLSNELRHGLHLMFDRHYEWFVHEHLVGT
jgi:hypothetical protein